MKIAVCTPCHSSPKSPYAEALGQLLIETARRLPESEIELRIRGSSNLPLIRTALADWAIGWGADWVLFVDSDQIFPRDALLTLLAHDKPIVGANIAMRGDPTGPTAAKVVNGRPEWVWTTKEKIDRGELEEVDRLAFGLVLIRADVFRQTPKPWFTMSSETAAEDYFFCEVAQRQGFSVFIDHRVSARVGHLHEVILTTESALLDRERFDGRRQAQVLTARG